VSTFSIVDIRVRLLVEAVKQSWFTTKLVIRLNRLCPKMCCLTSDPLIYEKPFDLIFLIRTKDISSELSKLNMIL